MIAIPFFPIPITMGSLPFVQANQPAPKFEAQNFQVLGQSTIIPVHDFAFHDPYSGFHSLRSNYQVATSETYTLFLGARVAKTLALYVDPEDTRGLGLGDGFGLSAAPNTEVIHTSKSVYPYWARAFMRWTVPTSRGGKYSPVLAAQNQLAELTPDQRIVVTAGKLSVADIFDTNGYANTPRTQFMNLDFVNSAGYDYAADIRGYSFGVAGEYYGPGYTLRLGVFQMPTEANGPTLDANFVKANGKQAELEWKPRLMKKHDNATVRVLGYLNHGRLGSYSQAVSIARPTSAIPDVSATDAPGRFKYGLNLNVEQPLADDGQTGLFFRAAANDGKTESFVYSEAEASCAFGIQLDGVKAHAPGDKLGLGFGLNGLGKDHRAYLEAGGTGFQLGDGRLSYGVEQLTEAYYNHRLAKNMFIGVDLQEIFNPGYNRSRGPVTIGAIRFHWEF